MAQKWVKGEKRRIKATFTPDAGSGAPTEPVKVNIKHEDGSQLVDNQNAVKDPEVNGTYPFHYDFTPPKAGKIDISFKSADDSMELKQEEVIEDSSIGGS